MTERKEQPDATVRNDFTRRLTQTIPYSLCGQAMFTIERLNQHNRTCGYCINRMKTR